MQGTGRPCCIGSSRLRASARPNVTCWVSRLGHADPFHSRQAHSGLDHGHSPGEGRVDVDAAARRRSMPTKKAPAAGKAAAPKTKSDKGVASDKAAPPGTG